MTPTTSSIVRAAVAGLLLVFASLAAAQPASQPRDGGTLEMGLESSLPGFDPLDLGSLADRTAAMAFYDTLMRVDEEGRIQPNLAASLDASKDGKTYIATLRQGIRFQDGTPFNAQAVVFNFRRVMDPANGCRCAAMVDAVKSVEQRGEYQVAFHLKAPNAAFPAVLANVAGMEPSPTAIREAEKDGGQYGEHPVGTGPFVFVSWQRGVAVTGKRNEHYWRAGLPHLDKVVFRPIPDKQTRLQTLRSGGIQLMMTPRPNSVKKAELGGLPGLKVTRIKGFGTSFIMFQTHKPPLDDVRVRQALAYATNRALIVKSVGAGLFPLADSPFGAGTPAGRQKVDFPGYDPDKARALLKEYGKPVSFTLSVVNTPLSSLFAQVVQQMWAKVGVKVEIRKFEQLHFINKITQHDFDAALSRWTGRPDPDGNVYPFFYSDSPRNYVRFDNAQMDQLLIEGRTTTDPGKRAAVYHQISQLLAEQVPYLFLMSFTNYFLSSDAVHGLPKIPDGVARLATVWLAQ